MARFATFITASAVAAVLYASPIASATGQIEDQGVPGALATAVPEQQLCAQRDRLVRDLAQLFDETPLAVGQVDNQAVVEIFASGSGSWTILATGTDGVSCIVTAGEGFDAVVTPPGVGV